MATRAIATGTRDVRDFYRDSNGHTYQLSKYSNSEIAVPADPTKNRIDGNPSDKYKRWKWEREALKGPDTCIE